MIASTAGSAGSYIAVPFCRVSYSYLDTFWASLCREDMHWSKQFSSYRSQFCWCNCLRTSLLYNGLSFFASDYSQWLHQLTGDSEGFYLDTDMTLVHPPSTIQTIYTSFDNIYSRCLGLYMVFKLAQYFHLLQVKNCYRLSWEIGQLRS